MADISDNTGLRRMDNWRVEPVSALEEKYRKLAATLEARDANTRFSYDALASTR